MISYPISIDLKPLTQLTSVEQNALHDLADIALPAKPIAPFSQPQGAWIRPEIKRASPQWNVIVRDSNGQIAVCIGVLTRTILVNGISTCVGGIGRVMVQADYQEQGYAIAAIQYAVAFLNEAHNTAFELVMCQAALVPFYESIGWQCFRGELLIKQRRATASFTMHQPMLLSIEQQIPQDGVIHLCGLPW
jgi:predicted acetyltransferase